MTNVPGHMCEWGSWSFAYILFSLVATRWQHMLDSKLYSDGERAGESRGIFEMRFQGCAQKCEFGMESTTAALSRDADLAVERVKNSRMDEDSLLLTLFRA